MSITTGRDKTRTSTTKTLGTSRPGDLSIADDGWHQYFCRTTVARRLSSQSRRPGQTVNYDRRTEHNIVSDTGRLSRRYRPRSITAIDDDRRTIIVMLLLLSFITGENITSNVIDDKRYTKYFRNHHHHDKVMFLSWYIYLYILLLTDEKLIVGRGGDDVVGSRYQLQLLDIRIIDKIIGAAPIARLFRPSFGQMMENKKKKIFFVDHELMTVSITVHSYNYE